MRKTKIIGILVIIFGVTALIGSAIFSATRAGVAEDLEKDAPNLGQLIDGGNDYEGTYATVTAEGEAFLFAQKEGSGTRGYYFVVDENYNYVVYMTEGQAARLEESGTLELKGATKLFTNEIRRAAVSWMNQTNEENEITTANFREYFGNVYLDATKTATDMTTELNMAVRISLVAGIVLIIVGVGLAARGKW